MLENMSREMLTDTAFVFAPMKANVISKRLVSGRELVHREYPMATLAEQEGEEQKMRS